MKAFLPVILAVALIGTATFLQGSWSDRWNDQAAQALARQTANYDSIPMTVGDWVGQDAPENEQQLKLAGAHESISRVYTHRHDKSKQVMVFMILGKSRDVSKHEPKHCYVGAGFQMAHDPRNYHMTTTEGTADFYTSTFSKMQGDHLSNQRILWAWSADGNWEAPEMPRLKYGPTTALNKMYLITNAAEGQSPDDAPSVDFAKVFLPAVSDAIFGDRNAAASDEAPAADEPETEPSAA